MRSDFLPRSRPYLETKVAPTMVMLEEIMEARAAVCKYIQIHMRGCQETQAAHSPVSSKNHAELITLVA